MYDLKKAIVEEFPDAMYKDKIYDSPTFSSSEEDNKSDSDK